jgi:hypothetical protein
LGKAKRRGVYEENPEGIDELKTVITDVISSTSKPKFQRMFENNIRHVENR